MTNPHGDRVETESKYSLVVAAAKRARQIVSRGELLPQGRKPVTVALEEISLGRIRIVPQKNHRRPDQV